jgi:hypothetical protein
MSIFTGNDIIQCFDDLGLGFPNGVSNRDDFSESHYDGLEVSAVIEYRAADGNRYCEPIYDLSNIGDASNIDSLFFTLYAHIPDGRVRTVHNFHSRFDARAAFNALSAQLNPTFIDERC